MFPVREKRQKSMTAIKAYSTLGQETTDNFVNVFVYIYVFTVKQKKSDQWRGWMHENKHVH